MAAPGLEPGPIAGQDPKSCVSANSTKRPELDCGFPFYLSPGRLSSRDFLAGSIGAAGRYKYASEASRETGHNGECHATPSAR